MYVNLFIAFGYNLFLFLAAIFSLFLPWVPPWISTFHCSSKHLWWYKVRSPVFNKVVWIRPHPLMFWYILSHRELEVIIISDCWPGTNASRLLLFIKTWTQGFSKINEQIITICITTELAWDHIENLSVWDKTIFLTSTCIRMLMNIVFIVLILFWNSNLWLCHN